LQHLRSFIEFTDYLAGDFLRLKAFEPFFSTYIATRQEGGLGRHLLVDAVLQASQVEVGISRKGTENNGRLNGNVRDRQCE
jgi:hypothetical protein